MANLDMHKTICTKSELDIFATPPTQNCVESGQMQCYRPISTIDGESPIEFLIPGHGDEYIDLAHTMLHISAKIDNINAANTNIAPVNNWLHSLFSQVDIYLNQKCVTPPSNSYNYRAYIENLLNYGSDAKNSHLATNFWYKDTAGFMNNTVDDKNSGFQVRKDLSKDSQVIDMFGNLHCDLFNQDKYLINGVEMTVRLQKSKNSFHLMCSEDTGAKVCIIDAILYVRKIKINPSIIIAHARALSIATAKYPITRVDIKTISIPKDLQSKTIDNLYIGHLPKRCIIGFVQSKAFNGCISLNPFNFEHFNHNFLSLYMDSIQIPSRPLTPDFAKNLYTHSYFSLYSGSGVYFKDIGNTISRNDYPKGFCLTAFDLTPDLAGHESHWSILKSGCLRAEIKFEKPLSSPITAIIFSEFDNVIEIDKTRNVFVDYSS